MLSFVDKRAGLEYGESAALQATVEEVAEIVNQRVMDVVRDRFFSKLLQRAIRVLICVYCCGGGGVQMMNRYRLLQHCFGIKKYIMLSAGDFIQHLMDILSPELEKRADRIFAHNMMGFIQHAARASNAQYDDEDTLSRLSAHVLTVRSVITFFQLRPVARITHILCCESSVLLLRNRTAKQAGMFFPSTTESICRFQLFCTTMQCAKGTTVCFIFCGD